MVFLFNVPQGKISFCPWGGAFPPAPFQPAIIHILHQHPVWNKKHAFIKTDPEDKWQLHLYLRHAT